MATEKRLIDANECYEMADKCYAYFYYHVADLPILRNLLNNCPTVDAVEVVRCKDCKYWEQYNACDGTKPHRCMNYDAIFYKRTKADDFCSYGERKDNV